VLGKGVKEKKGRWERRRGVKKGRREEERVRSWLS
jgi:hypothetical protein